MGAWVGGGPKETRNLETKLERDHVKWDQAAWGQYLSNSIWLEWWKWHILMFIIVKQFVAAVLQELLVSLATLSAQVSRIMKNPPGESGEVRPHRRLDVTVEKPRRLPLFSPAVCLTCFSSCCQTACRRQCQSVVLVIGSSASIRPHSSSDCLSWL